jgi:hypothetical protein
MAQTAEEVVVAVGGGEKAERSRQRQQEKLQK